MIKIILVVIVGVLLFGCKERPMEANNDSIGIARMLNDGTITLNLRAEDETGIVGHVYLEYKPDDPQYEDIKQHIGDIRPGEEKLVPPWPE